MSSRFLISFFCLFLVCAAPSFAQDKKETKEVTPITKWIEAENELLSTLPKENQKVFFIMRNKHSVIRTIDVVHRDIKNAVKACGKENKDIRSEMNDRLKEWESAVLPVIKEAQKFLKRELKEQDAFHVTDYNHVTKLNDKAYSFSESKVEKQVVTTEKACQGLLNSMDDTEDKLISLLQDILLPQEVIQNRVERDAKNK